MAAIREGLDKLRGIRISPAEGTPKIPEAEAIADSEIATPRGYTPLAFHVSMNDHGDAWMIVYPGATDTLHPQFGAPEGTPDVLEMFETVAFVDAETGRWLEAVTVCRSTPGSLPWHPGVGYATGRALGRGQVGVVEIA